MKPVPGTLQGGGAAFRTTHWNVIADCALSSNQGSNALAQLCRDYWPPLYSFLRRRGYSPADSQDLVQGFFAYFLQNRGYTKADSGKGRFRSFLLASLKNYVANVWDREHASKRGGGRDFVLLDEEMHSAEILFACDSTDPILDEDLQYEESWASTLVRCALARLSSEFKGHGRIEIFKELSPFLRGGTALPDQRGVAQRLKIPINTLRSHISRLRTRYSQILREEVARTIGRADDVDEELRHLRMILMRIPADDAPNA